MRIIYLFSLLLSFAFSSAQSDFSSQLKAIIADSSNNFRKFQASFKQIQGTDSIYYSGITINDTKKNDIVAVKGMTLYRAVIVDSVTEKNGKRIVNEWQKRIKLILSESFKSAEAKIEQWNPSKYGWKFNCGNVLVSVDLFPNDISSSLCWVCLGITYFSGENQLQ